jgi:hypothetical protein
MATIADNNLISQSPYLYLQGAGSDGSDGSAQGVHLRWDFGEPLAGMHIPKGNLAAQGSDYHTTAGFNKQDDFVKIYRTSYNRNFPIIIDFASMEPSQIPDSGQIWQYNNLVPIPALPDNTCQVLIRFTDADKYNQAKQQYDPAVDRLNFLKSYDGIIEAEVEGRLMFSVYVQMEEINEQNGSITRIESISRSNEQEYELFISSRKKYEASSSYLQKEDLDLLLQENGGYLELDDLNVGDGKIMAENIRYIRFRGENCFPTMLLLETYHDFLLGKNQLSGWEPVTELSLSIDQNTVFERLEKTNEIDNLWTKYKNGATVKVANYKARWYSNDNEPENNLLNGVITYLNASKDAGNLSAENQPSDTETSEEEVAGEFKISYLSLLKLAAFDFHIARMLGFGHIDATISDNQYIYIAVYETTAALDGMPAALRTHTFMTLPVGKTDYKLPVTPELRNLEYGLCMSGETEIPIWLTDENGYSQYDNSRVVNLHVTPFDSMLPMGEFFVPDEEYSYTDRTEPILFGIAYRKNGDTEWHKPEINHDSEFKDHEEVYESVAVIRPDTKSNLIFSHIETEEGVHTYAVYGINWFSRVSDLSNIKHTDETVFPIKNTLIPPLNLGVQLIQKEDPLIFTTQAEQDRLNALESEADKTLVRLTFEWNDIHASNYWYGREAEFFFRSEPLFFIKGKIKSVTDLGQGLYDIRTESYNIDSMQQVVSPIVAIGTESRFFKSILTTNEDQSPYEVRQVRQSDVPGEGAIFTIKAPENRELIDPDNDNEQHIVNAPVPPTVNSTFSVSENLSLAESWSVPLVQKVALKKFSDYTELYTDSQGTTSNTPIGGIFEEASITELLAIDDTGAAIEGSKTGIYRIIFNNYVLEPHADYPTVEWYKGTVRIKVLLPNNKEEMRTLEVWSIEKENNGMPTPTLQLIARDGTFDLNPDSGYISIPTGENIPVNYHPGYRVYFTCDPGFDQSSLLPATGYGSKQTLIACRSTDPTVNNGIASPLSTPAVILAREIIEPVQPEKPMGGQFATRPNFYGKATYTIDTKVNTENGREPYALLFYRANEQLILDTLYTHDTVLQIQADLAQIENDTAFANRWNELVNVVTDDSGQFKEWNGYRFPYPDNNTFGMGNPSVEQIKFAIDNAFLSLTEQPVLYRYLKKAEDGHQTSDRKPVIRDTDGNLIMPGSPEYDGSPMAVTCTINGNKAVRFTDYTLDGTSTSIFFYYAKEMNNMLSVSNRSEIAGPIRLINTAPPKAPEIREFHTRPENEVTGDTTAVLFKINDYPQGEEVSKILIYRALNAVDAMTIRTMQLAKTIHIGEHLIDDFSDLDFYPFGEVLYYRLVAVRTVKTKETEIESGVYEYETEEVPSYPSSLILSNIIDINNPPAPNLDYTADTNGDTLENVVIKWNPTTYNGTYYLYQMNNSGNWTEIYRISSKNAPMQYELPDGLPKIDEDGNNMYYRFKVMVENSSGLFGLEENVLTI